MDFEMQYTKEQEDFRKEVRSWLNENAKVPTELGEIPHENWHITREMWDWGVHFRSKLEKRGGYSHYGTISMAEAA